MTFRWSPLPWLGLEEGGGAEIALNLVVYGLTLSTLGTCVWLAHIAWVERER